MCASPPSDGRYDPSDFDIALHDTGFLLNHQGDPFTTIGGRPCWSTNRRVLEDIMVDVLFNDSPVKSASRAWQIFSVETDLVTPAPDGLAAVVAGFVREDPGPALKRGVGVVNEGEGQVEPAMLTLSADVLPGIFQRLYQMIQEAGLPLPNLRAELPEELLRHIVERWSRLSTARKAGVLYLHLQHGAGIILPLMLVEGRLNATAYAAAAIVLAARSMARIPADARFEGYTAATTGEPRSSLSDFCMDALSVIDYVQGAPAAPDTDPSPGALIARGEGFHQEFKSTLRWNLKAEKKDPAIEHASLKTITAFLNSDGGTLIIGVADDGSPVGIELDDFPNDDKFLLHFWNLVKASLGQDMTPFITAELATLADKRICIICCTPATRPAFLRQKGFDEEFYIRVGPASASLNISEALQYISDRFH